MTFKSLQFINILRNFQTMSKKLRNDTLINAIALELGELRATLSLSQEFVYNDLGIHIGRIETGSTNLSVSTLDVLLKYYDISFSEFFKQVEERLNPTDGLS
ncbi:transcription regulator [Dokdonia sp. MED134]|nr:transcription regulator [Dokdonia sp. MED134]